METLYPRPLGLFSSWVYLPEIVVLEALPEELPCNWLTVVHVALARVIP